MLRLHEAHVSAEEIAAQLGRSTGAITARLRHVVNQTLPQPAEASTPSTVSSTASSDASSTKKAARVARHAPPVAPTPPPPVSVPSRRSLPPKSKLPAESPSSAMAALRISASPKPSPAQRDVLPHICTALESYNAEHARTFQALPRTRSSQPCSSCGSLCSVANAGASVYFSAVDESENETLCVRCMVHEHLQPYMVLEHLGGTASSAG